MKITESWLREWSNPDISVEDIASALTMSGLEVDGIEPVAPPFSGVVVGRIISTEPHPNADKLKITRVDIGESEPLQIVCGAPNAREGILVPTAKVGAILPGDFAIKSAKLRGTESFGMLCSAKEIGISAESDGLHELADDAQIGRDIREQLELDDHIIEVDLTPNRGDCLSLRGIARELSVRTGASYNSVDIQAITPAIDDSINVKLNDPSHCPRYVGRVIRGIKANAQAPNWIKRRLEQVDVRSHSLIVDVTNYVMLSLGQPMHAFDANKLSGDITVRLSKDNESLMLLNDKTVDFHIPTLLITDASGPIAMAGIMGGAATEVQEDSTDIFLESAFFTPETIAGKAREYGMQTDASHRFERGVALDTQTAAIELATQLIIDAAGGQPGPVNITEASDALPQAAKVILRRQQISRKLGIVIDDARIEEILSRLEIDFEINGNSWTITPPDWRFDIRIEDDLIEELGRIHGYDKIPATTPAIKLQRPQISESHRSAKQLRQQMIALGYSEIVAYSFIADELNDIFYADKTPIALANPISQDMSSMRTSLLPGLMKTLAYNQTRQQSRAQLFDMGICFDHSDQQAQLPQQNAKAAGLIWGRQQPESWQTDSRNVDFYDIKADVEHLLAERLSALSADNQSNKIEFRSAAVKGFHPGQCAEIISADRVIGVVGKLHPNSVKAFAAKGDVYAFETDLEALLSKSKPEYQRLAKFPSSRRDIAIVVKDNLAFADIQRAIMALNIEHLQSAFLFDVYRGENLAAAHVSLAIGLTFQSTTETLKDTDIDAKMTIIISALAAEFDATLRD